MATKKGPNLVFRLKMEPEIPQQQQQQKVAAHTRVLAIPELFHAILLHLPLNTLLISSAVSKHWHRTVTKSSTIQERLFFTYHPPQSSSSSSSNSQSQSSLTSFSSSTTTLVPSSSTSNTTESIHNPLLKSLFPPLFQPRPPPSYYGEHGFNSTHIRSLPWHSTHKSAVLNPHASWRRMYPVHPPACIDLITDRSGCGCHWDNERGSIAPELQIDKKTGIKGIKMGALYDIAIEQMDEYNGGGGVCVEWLMFKECREPYWIGEERRMWEAQRKEDELEGLTEEEREVVLRAQEEEEEEVEEVFEDATTVRNAINISVCWHRECYGEKCLALSGLEIHGKRKIPPLVSWKTVD